MIFILVCVHDIYKVLCKKFYKLQYINYNKAAKVVPRNW